MYSYSGDAIAVGIAHLNDERQRQHCRHGSVLLVSALHEYPSRRTRRAGFREGHLCQSGARCGDGNRLCGFRQRICRARQSLAVGNNRGSIEAVILASIAKGNGRPEIAPPEYAVAALTCSGMGNAVKTAAL